MEHGYRQDGSIAAPLLVVIGGTSGHRVYHEYLLAAISSEYRIHLVDRQEPTWVSPYIVGNTVVSTTDLETVCGAVTEIASRERIQGVLSWHETTVHQTAAVAERFGLPTTPTEAVGRCRDKYRSRCALALLGVPQPEFDLAGTIEDALASAERIGYPVVVKPRAAAGSYGVSLVRSPEEMTDRFEFACRTTFPHMPEYEKSVLVEEFLNGPELSVDSAVISGDVHPLFVGRKRTGYLPYFEELGHIVSHGDRVLADPEFLDLLQQTHAALGFTTGWTHTEVKLPPGSAAKIIEVNARLGGDMIPYLGMAASGINPGLIAAAVACGCAPEIKAERELVAGVRFFYVEQDNTVIDSAEFDHSALSDEIDRTVVLVSPGDVVSPPPQGLRHGRIAYATAVAASAEACEAALDSAGTALRVITRDEPGHSR